jgi:hypothetical protein
VRRLAAALALLLACAGAWAVPRQIASEYELTSTGMTIGQVRERFVREGDTYRIESVSRALGVLKLLHDETITLQSSGTVGPEGLRPLRFEERRARDPQRNVSASFDWERGVMRSDFRGKTTEHALAPRTQDRLSMLYQFMHLTPRAGTVELAMSNGRKVARYSYRLVGEPRIATPAGEFDTFHFERVPTEPGDSRVEVWLAKERHLLPVRVVFDDPGGFRVEQTLTALQVQ